METKKISIMREDLSDNSGFRYLVLNNDQPAYLNAARKLDNNTPYELKEQTGKGLIKLKSETCKINADEKLYNLAKNAAIKEMDKEFSQLKSLDLKLK